MSGPQVAVVSTCLVAATPRRFCWWHPRMMVPHTIEQFRARPLYVVVLAPRFAAVAAREAGRGKVAYGAFTVEDLDTVLRDETPRIGLWLDTSDLTVDQTVAEILARAESALTTPRGRPAAR